MTYPRRPTNEEKIELTEILFPEKSVGDIDFSEVWMLSPMTGSPDFNCFAWSILAVTTIPIPDKLATVAHLARHAKKLYAAPYDYEPAPPDHHHSVILAWGQGTDEILHASRRVTKPLLSDRKDEFRLKLDVHSPDARGFPDETWSSKLGDGVALIAHPKHWLEGGVFGPVQGAFKIVE